MSATSTPHTEAARSASHSPASSCPSSSALSSARSVPGLICRWMSATAAASVRRGSTTISFAPRSCAARMRPHRIGWQAEALEPSSRMQLRQLEVGVRGRRPVGAEDRVVARDGAGHAQARVGVDVVGAQVALGELVDRVVVLGQQLAGDVERDLLGAIARQPRGDVVERLVPRDVAEAMRRVRAQLGLQRTVGRPRGLRQRQRLAARQPTVDRMLLVAAHGMQAPVADLRDEPAADAAVRATGLDHHTGASAVLAQPRRHTGRSTPTPMNAASATMPISESPAP